ncbi:SGNH/GDSL hydrolase family protein [Dokdonella fugitiva]|jgi:lysophospholipase L1-like esterase|uniref:SGNH/GDSL hydrolase family protein n=1 Tax=Dokdonella fugitiva TaxID=328517 RepID=UPI0015FCCED8|nr:GDSL-type esterase/lipase family protein [Dokdonella fugitiva]MBA8883704.1 lysophospholipase L1-like esterase [Dokdonella fugitiva]
MNTATYLALGDSYTIGEGVEADERWPAQLARRLRAHGVALADPALVATTGWTTDELSAAMDAATFAPPYALVSLLIGVNNQYRGRPLDEYRAQFGALLGRAVALAGSPARVFVVSIPDWGVTRFARAEGRDGAAVGAEIDAFNAAARAIAADAGIPFVDVTAASRDAGDAEAMLVADGLHPSAAQYALWTDEIVPVARALLAAAPA